MKKLFLLGLCLAFLSVSSMAFAEDVFVTTKGGAKYHKADCQLIKNRETTSMDEKEAVEQGYEPCRRCFKEKFTKAKPEGKTAQTAKVSSGKSKSKKSQ